MNYVSIFDIVGTIFKPLGSKKRTNFAPEFKNMKIKYDCNYE